MSIRLLEPIPYGSDFFELLRFYDAIVVPSISDEQPRIVYDAYSQAVPVLASSTPGLSSCVADGQTGKFVPPGDDLALAGLLQWAAINSYALERLGMNGLDKAGELTHHEMHRKRCYLIAISKRAFDC